MITIPAEALFDILQNNEAEFRYEYTDYKLIIEIIDGLEDEPYIEAKQNWVLILMRKSSFMKLLLNRVFVCDEYAIKISGL